MKGHGGGVKGHGRGVKGRGRGVTVTVVEHKKVEGDARYMLHDNNKSLRVENLVQPGHVRVLQLRVQRHCRRERRATVFDERVDPLWVNRLEHNELARLAMARDVDLGAGDLRYV